VIVLTQSKILIGRANNPYCDCRKVSFRYTDQEFVLSACEHLQDLGHVQSNQFYYPSGLALTI